MDNKVLWFACGAYVLRVGLLMVFGPVVDWVIAGVIAVVYGYLVVRFAVNYWQIRHALRILRRLTPADRLAFLNEPELGDARVLFEILLEEHGEPQAAGAVEKFEFSPVDRRELTLLTWATAAAAVLLSVTPSSLGLDGLWRIAAFSAVLVLASVVWLLLRRSEQWSRRFEVSPFGLSEFRPDGSVHRLLWGRGMILRNRPRLQRIELALEDSRDSIEIPYRVVGFDQLVEAILSNGGFESGEAT